MLLPGLEREVLKQAPQAEGQWALRRVPVEVVQAAGRAQEVPEQVLVAAEEAEAVCSPGQAL